MEGVLMSVGVVVGVVIVVAVGGLAAILVGMFNNLVEVRNNIDKAFANIEVLLKQRHDELPKLIATCKGYMRHERELLEDLTRLRERYLEATSTDDKIAISNQIDRAMKTLSHRWEAYPDLKSSENFLQIQERIAGLESSIADRRELFNDAVNAYNIRIGQLPDLLLARTLGYRRRGLLEVSEEDRRDVEMDFSTSRPERPASADGS